MRSLKELMNLQGRVALITGGGGHVGSVVCEALAELGAGLAVLDLDRESCERGLKRLSPTGPPEMLAVPCNLNNELETRQSVRRVINELGHLDIIVHCAAYVGMTVLPGWSVPLEEQTVAAWDAAMRVNLTSAFVMVQEARQALAASGRGSVIFFASIYGLVGPDMRLYAGTSMGNPAGYSASKGALLQLTRYLSTVLAPRVRVNAISPGGIWRSQPQTFQERYVVRTPLGRMATEEDLKGAVAYLASDLSAYVTGHNLVVDGGWTAW